MASLETVQDRQRLLSLVPQPPSISRDSASEAGSEDGFENDGAAASSSLESPPTEDPPGGSPGEEKGLPHNDHPKLGPGAQDSDQASNQDTDEESSTINNNNSSINNKLTGSRLNSRRATDFSQADNDLRRCLASRKTKEGYDPELTSPTQLSQDLRRDHAVFHRRIYGSVEALEGEERVQRNRRFRVEDSSQNQECTEIPATPVLENPEHQTKWYYKYFLGKLHRNYVGQDDQKNTFILSVLEEKSFGKSQYRAILWTAEGPKRLRFRFQDKNITLKQMLCKLSVRLDRLPREVLSPNIQKDILWVEKQECSSTFKFGVIYAKPGQIMDDELLSNQDGSQAFNNFLHILGQRIRLKDW